MAKIEFHSEETLQRGCKILSVDLDPCLPTYNLKQRCCQDGLYKPGVGVRLLRVWPEMDCNGLGFLSRDQLGAGQEVEEDGPP